MSARRPRVKICCIADPDEALLAIDAGADALGLVGPMPSGPGVIDEATAREIARVTPPPVSTFLLTSLTDAEGITDQVRACGVDTVQVVNHVDPRVHLMLTETLPHTRRVQVIHVEDETALERIEEYEPLVHAFLLDSGSPSGGVLGGTGRTHDWNVSAQFVETTSLPVFLAGGLRPDNVARAVNTVRPYGLDLCSGVRTDGRLDAGKLARFFAEL